MTNSNPFILDVSNFKIVQDAHIEVATLTLIRGQNDSGKSSLFQALHTVVANESSDSQIKYGAGSFTVRMSVAGRTVAYSRKRKGSPVVKIDNGEPLDKLGRLSLTDIDPTFPIRALKFPLAGGDTEKFYPNFVFQEQLPVFGQVDIYAFFSAMFEPVARVSRHLYAVRKRVALANSNVSSVKAQSDSLLEMFNGINASLALLDEPTVILCHDNLLTGMKLAAKVSESLAKVASLETRKAALKKYAVLEGNDFNIVADHYQHLTSLQETLGRREKLLTTHALTNSRLGTAVGYEARLPKVASLKELQRLVDLLSIRATKFEHLTALQEEVLKASYAVEVVEWLGGLKTSYATLTELQSKLNLFQGLAKKTGIKKARYQLIVQKIEPFRLVASSYVVVQNKVDLIRSITTKVLVQEADLTLCRSELSSVSDCPVCGAPLKESLTHIVGAVHA